MKTVCVMHAGHPALESQAADIRAFCARDSQGFSQPETWCFYHGEIPATIPETLPGEHPLKMIPVAQPYLAESYLDLLLQQGNVKEVRQFIFPASAMGKQLATRLAYRLGGSSCLNVNTADFQTRPVRVFRFAAGHYMNALVELKTAPFCISAARQAGGDGKAVAMSTARARVCENIEQPCFDWLKSVQTSVPLRKNSLEQADIVLAVGQGINGKQALDDLKPLVRRMGAQSGVSRPVAMNAWADMERLIGASGILISPKVCIAAGISGSGFFMLGIENSGVIVAINTDPAAPIFKQADVGIVGDLKSILKKLDLLLKDNPLHDPGMDKGNA